MVWLVTRIFGVLVYELGKGAHVMYILYHHQLATHLPGAKSEYAHALSALNMDWCVPVWYAMQEPPWIPMTPITPYNAFD